MHTLERHGAVHIVEGDLFSASREYPIDTLVNAVNCKGVSGAGIAYIFKHLYAQNQKNYEAECGAGRLRPGKLFLYDYGSTLIVPEALRYIINFPTKDDWRDPSHIEYIESGLRVMCSMLGEKISMRYIAMPALGCGYGGLDWLTVKKAVIDNLSGFEDRNICLFKPK